MASKIRDLSLQYMPSPEVPVGYPRLPELDPSYEMVRTKPASDIYPTEEPDEPRTYGNLIKKAGCISYLMKHHLPEDELRELVGPALESDYRQISKSLQAHLEQKQNKMMSTGEETSKWLGQFLSSEIGFEDFLVRLYNMRAQSAIHKRRTGGLTNKQHRKNVKEANELDRVAAAMKQEMVHKIKKEIKKYQKGEGKIFRWDERSEAGLDESVAEELRDEEVERLEGILAHVEAWPESKFEELNVRLPLHRRDDVPDRLLAYGKRSPQMRYEFWKSRMQIKGIVSLYYHFTAENGIALYESIKKAERGPLSRYMQMRAAAMCDLYFDCILKDRVEYERSKLLKDRDLRVAAKMYKPETKRFFQSMRDFYNTYETKNWNGELAVPTLEHLLVRAGATMESVHTRKNARNNVTTADMDMGDWGFDPL